jgi:hypothetical protein
MTIATTLSTWEETEMRFFDLKGDPLGRAGRWVFYEHPTKGDEHPLLATSFDYIGDDGPVVFNTLDYDLPDAI